MPAIDFYHMPMSAPCRAVQMLASELKIELNCKLTNLMAKEQLKPEFIKINPTHTIPTIVDDGFALWESRAILQYLCNKSKSDLYPVDIKKRAVVDRMLQFDQGTLYKSLGEFLYPQLFMKQPADAEKGQKFKEALTLLDGFIGSNGYVAGNKLTIADLSIFAGLTFIETILDYDLSEWKNVNNWMNKLKKDLPCHQEVNVKSLEEAKVWLKSK